MDITKHEFNHMELHKKLHLLYTEGEFVVSIRYYKHKINLYLLDNFYVEVYYNPKTDRIDQVKVLHSTRSKMKFYADQIRIADY